MAKVSEKLFKIFVYGTLKNGEFNHSLLTNANNGFARYLGEGKTVEKYPLIIGTRFNIPFLLDKCGRGQNVNGEVYEVDEEMLKKLDELEEYPEYYDREIQEIKMEKRDEVTKCWLYLMRNCPDHLLQKPLLNSYHSSTDFPYKPRSERDSDINIKDEMI
uniref:Gamma-glutamylcyclotransferase family protein n=1 Tax=Glossina morsitans morsitans TaxID=37546 RepID=A0A1B0GBU8_GLOMM